MVPQQPIRVLIVDDHHMLRSGLRQFIDTFDDLVLAGEARNGAEAVQQCLVDPPDVILMDMVMPVMDGMEATRQILQKNPEMKIIFLTSFQEQDLVKQALQSGAKGYLLKNASAEDLANAIRSAHAGRSTLAPEAVDALIRATRQKNTLGSDLSDRERQVLTLLVEGDSNAQIAEKLSISTATVKYHVGGIFSKLGVNSRSQAITLAWQQNLVGK
jgi:NarL family two-component system response regulator LiaR